MREAFEELEGVRSRLTIAFLSFLFLISICSAQDVESPGLVSELGKVVQETTRPIYTYHYVTKEKLHVSPDLPLDLDDPNVSHHVQDWSVHYTRAVQAKVKVGEMTQGFFLAVDPLASRIFGGEDDQKTQWVLYRIEFPKNFRILDSDRLPDLIPKNVRSELSQLGCEIPEKSPSGDAVIFSSLFRWNFGEKCRELTLDALKRLGIDAIKYDFTASEVPGCPAKDQSAFILIHPDHLQKDSVQIFSKETETDDPKVHQEMVYTESLFSSWKQSKLWPELDGKPIGGRDAWLRKHFLNCQSASIVRTVKPCHPGESSALSESQLNQLDVVQGAARRIK